MSFDPKVIAALTHLRLAARTGLGLEGSARESFEALDDAGVFAALDEQTDGAAAEGILAEQAARTLTGTGHDSRVCDAGPLASPSQHSGTCPTWARHHHL